MKHYYQMFLLAGLLMTGCSQENAESGSNVEPYGTENGIVMKAKPFEAENLTRTSFDENLTVSWTQGDLVGVFGESGDQQVRLDMTNGGSTTTATFTSEDFQLKKDGEYVAYYPLVDKVTAKPNIAVSYDGQTQAGNSSVAHLAAYDYMVASATATETNTATFEFSHTAAILKLNITMPDAGKWSAVTLSTDDNTAFTTSATLNLLETDLIGATEQANSVTLALAGANNEGYIETTAADEVLTVWMMLSPTDYFNATDAKTMTVTVKSATEGVEDVAFGTTPSKTFESGKYYVLDVAATSEQEGIGTFKVGDSKYVTFAAGNLQYNLGTKKYQLASNQWEYLSTGNCTYTINNDYVTATNTTDASGNCLLDLFGWGSAWAPTFASSTGTDYLYTTNKLPAATGGAAWTGSIASADFTADTYDFDWGTAAANDVTELKGSHTLTNSEWIGLFQYQCWARVDLSGDGIDGTVFGVVVFPYGVDATTANGYLASGSVNPAGTITSSKTSLYSYTANAKMTVEKLNASGALFLPAGGFYNTTAESISESGSAGYYWSSTGYYSTSNNIFFMSKGSVSASNAGSRMNRLPVRLAIDVDAPN